jgi:hypothetical protein
MSTAPHPAPRHSGLRRRMMLALPAALATAALIALPSVSAAATPAGGPSQVSPTVAPAPTTTGIIMRDGGVCDPIRHMGC